MDEVTPQPDPTDVSPAPVSKTSKTLALLLAMAMFVLVVDTSIMNVSISAVVKDIGTTVSGVQSAIALEALVSAAFILIGSKVGDLIGRKRAYVLGLLGYAVGALAMTLTQSLVPIIIFWAIIGGLGASLLLPAMQSLIHGNFEGAERKKVYALGALSMALAQDLTAIIIFWAIIGGLGASLLLPAMQSLIHGNFEGAEQKKAYALVGAAAAIAAAVGPCWAASSRPSSRGASRSSSRSS